MPRPISLLLLGLLCCAFGLAIAIDGDAINPNLAPGLRGIVAFLVSNPAAPPIVGATAGLLVFLLVGFFAPAAADGFALATLGSRLRSLRVQPTPEAFLAAFHSRVLIDEGRIYAAGLWQGRASTITLASVWLSSCNPFALFEPAKQAREAMGSLFSSACLALLAVGGLAWLLLPGSGAMPHLSIDIAAVAIAFFLGVRVLTYTRRQQIGEIAASVRMLFPSAETEFLVDRIAGLIADDDGARTAAIETASRSIGDRLDEAVKDLRNTFATHDRRIAASVATAVQRTTQPIATSIQDMLERMASEGASNAERLLQAVLAEFVDDFQQRFGTQLSEINALLGGTRTLADELRQSFADAEVTRARSSEDLSRAMLESVAHAVTSAVDRQTEAVRAIVEQADAAVSQTGSAVERLAARTDEARETWTERTEQIATAVLARSTDEMKRTAAAFNQVHAILETLSISVLPAVNKLVTTQERLYAAIETNRNVAHSISAAAIDLGEAAKVAREMVEHQVQFTRELAQLARGGGTPPAPADSNPAPVRDADLVRALGALHAETDDELKSLPSL